MDEGRAIVRYPTPSGELTRQIWLDDSRNPPASGPWTVVYDPKRPGRVRSLSDSNDPVPWAPPVLLVGLAGLVLLVLGIVHGLAPRVSVQAAAGLIPVRRYRLFSRPAWIQAATGTVRIALPGYFGVRPMLIPADQVCVVADDEGPADDSFDGVYQRPAVVPYLVTTSANLPPNLTLFFGRPQRLPPLRWWGAVNASLSWRAARSEAGLLVDGISLRVVDPAGAVNALAAAGISQTTRPASWLTDHHPLTVDPVAVQQAVRSKHRWRWVGGFGFLVFIAVQALRFVETAWAAVAVAVLVALTLLLRWWASSRDRRDGTAEPAAGSRHRAGSHS